MTRNINETFPPKCGMQKSNFLQDPGYVKGVTVTCCMLQAMLQGSTKYPKSKVSEDMHNILNTFISHVEGVEGSVHYIHTFNGMHVGGVEGSFYLYCGF